MISNAIHHAKNRNYRMAAVETVPSGLFAQIYNSQTEYSLRKPTDTHDYWTVTVDEKEWSIPRPQDALRLTHIGDRPRTRVFEKYTTKDVHPTKGDTVVDVGAFIGEFAYRAFLEADGINVTAVEPDRLANFCLQRNVWPSVDVKSFAAHDTNGFGTLYSPDDPSETGVLSPDADHFSLWSSKKIGKQHTQLQRLDTVFDHIDFLKIDAEGTEPEVLDGLGELRPTKIAVDVSEERDGDSPSHRVAEWLVERHYKTKRRGDVIFGWNG